jgi:hypothetical protein
LTLQWVAADLLTGRIVADLPSFDPQWPLKRTVSTVDTGSGTLHLAGAPENWEQAIREGASLVACYDDADDTLPIAWCGYVPTIGELEAASDEVPVNMATFEAMLDRVTVGNVTYTTSDHRDDIIADLVNTWFTTCGITYLQLSYTAGGGPTPPLMDSPPASIPTAAIIMQNTDDASVLKRMQQVTGQLGGEFTVNWAFSADQQYLVPTLVFGDRVGRAAVAGSDPAVTYELPGQLVNVRQLRDYSAGAGANKIVPYSSGQGETTPFGTPVVLPTEGRPVFEYRYQPASNTSPAGLAPFAQQAAKILGPGRRPIGLVVSLARANGRRLGVDWNLGDDIGYAVRSPYVDEEGNEVTIKAFPGGLSGVGRCIGYELTDTTITPVLADAEIYQESS